jgi:sterol desaturase/sphingolipid hydroxylase (fatty acid hydroxylase superfamily)
VIELLELAPLIFIGVFLLLAVLHGARHYQTPLWWRTRMLIVSAAMVVGSIGTAIFWAGVFGDRHLLDGAYLGTWPGAAVGILVYEFVHYWYHRAAHRFDWLWRLGHQMHHSAEAMDAFSANYLHPIDLFLFASWGSLIFYPLLGLTLEAGLICGAWLGFNAMFQHANIRTPQWLGYVMQRPESHVVHHQRGRHQHNYANLPLWDIAFGTFRNPRQVDGVEVGFYKGASTRILDMLLFRDAARRPQRQQESSVADHLAEAA